MGGFSFVVGNGRRVKFWTDKWFGDEPLCVFFLSLYAIDVLKKAWVVDLHVQTGEKGHWNPCFSRPLNDWEVAKLRIYL